MKNLVSVVVFFAMIGTAFMAVYKLCNCRKHPFYETFE